VNQDVRILEGDLHPLGIGDEVRREVAPVELHPLDDLEGGLHPLGLLDRDDAFLADLGHRVGDDVPDGLVVVGGDGADLGDLLGILRLLGHLLEFAGDDLDRLVDAALEVHRVVPGGDQLRAFAVDRLRQDGGGGGAVARDVARFGGDFLHHLSAHVLVLVGQLDLLGDGDAVLRDDGGAEGLVEDHVAAPGAEGDLDRVRQCIDANLDFGAGLLAELQDFRHIDLPPCGFSGI